MKKIQLLLMAFVSMALLHSCSIEKRHYRPGYHIEWKHRVKTADHTRDQNEEPRADRQEYIRAVKADTQLALQQAPAPLIEKQETAKVSQPGANPSKPARQAHTAQATGQNGKKMFSLPFIQHNNNHERRALRNIIPLSVSDTAMSDDARLIFAIIFLILGLAPFAVLIFVGPGSEFILDLTLWLVGLALVILAAAALSGFFAFAGWLLLVAAWIYALIVIIRHA